MLFLPCKFNNDIIFELSHVKVACGSSVNLLNGMDLQIWWSYWTVTKTTSICNDDDFKIHCATYVGHLLCLNNGYGTPLSLQPYEFNLLGGFYIWSTIHWSCGGEEMHFYISTWQVETKMHPIVSHKDILCRSFQTWYQMGLFAYWASWTSYCS